MTPNEQQTRETYRNTARDEGTTGKSEPKADQQPGLAADDTPAWRPPESDPEPRPVEPTLRTEDALPPASN